VITRVNASGIRQLREKWRVRGSCGSNQGCCGVNVLKAKDRGCDGHRGRASREACAAVAVKGLRFAAMNAPESGAPLTAILAAAVFQLREKCIFLVFHTTRPTGTGRRLRRGQEAIRATAEPSAAR
jgi:hypothetical protein